MVELAFSEVGGFEIGGIAGVILGAASQRKPILIDGFISTAGALIAQGICPLAMDYVIAAHRSVEPGHKIMLDHLGKQAQLDLHLRLGEGTGAALAMNLAAAVALYSDRKIGGYTRDTLGAACELVETATLLAWVAAVSGGQQL